MPPFHCTAMLHTTKRSFRLTIPAAAKFGGFLGDVTLTRSASEAVDSALTSMPQQPDGQSIHSRCQSSNTNRAQRR